MKQQRHMKIYDDTIRYKGREQSKEICCHMKYILLSPLGIMQREKPQLELDQEEADP